MSDAIIGFLRVAFLLAALDWALRWLDPEGVQAAIAALRAAALMP